jgi:2-haloacid dehalogenase
MLKERFDPAAIDAIVFDVIGTLVDDDATWAATAQRLATAADLPSASELLAHWTRSFTQMMEAVIDGDSPWRPHSRLVIDSANDAIRALGGRPTATTTALVSNLDAQYRAWPDVAEATAALRRGRLVAGVSNGDLDSLARLAHVNAISWHIVLSAGTARTFKPAPAAYRYAIDALRLVPSGTLFVAAHPWDLRAAARHGFRTAYVARPTAERPSPEDHFDITVQDVTALVARLA